jgi:hypothetical protein
MPPLFDQVSGYPIVFWKFRVGQASRVSQPFNLTKLGPASLPTVSA